MKKIILLICALNLTLTCCQNKMENEKKYSWNSAVSTPKNYPIEVFSGHLIVGETLKGGYSYLPFDQIIGNQEEMELASRNFSTSDSMEGFPPQHLDITWISYTENKTYSGIFELDYKKIEALMEKGDERSPFFIKETKKFEPWTDYLYNINVGLLPGGVVLIWVQGITNTTFVGRYQAHEELGDINWKEAYPQMQDDIKKGMTEMGKRIIKDLPQEIQNQVAQNKIPFGSWDSWFNTFQLDPVVQKEDGVETIFLGYVNGEEETILIESTATIETAASNPIPKKERAAPKRLTLEWHNADDIRMETQLELNDTKIIELFSHIKKIDKVQLVIDVETRTLPNEKKGLSLQLKVNDLVTDLNSFITSQTTYQCHSQYKSFK